MFREKGHINVQNRCMILIFLRNIFTESRVDTDVTAYGHNFGHQSSHNFSYLWKREVMASFLMFIQATIHMAKENRGSATLATKKKLEFSCMALRDLKSILSHMRKDSFCFHPVLFWYTFYLSRKPIGTLGFKIFLLWRFSGDMFFKDECLYPVLSPWNCIVKRKGSLILFFVDFLVFFPYGKLTLG